MKHSIKYLALFFLFSHFSIVSHALGEEKKEKLTTFYRYVNSQGVKVMAQSIPPQFIKNGYEIVTLSGEVIKTVAPAPSAEEAERVAQEKKAAAEQARYDLQLHRTYSTAAEIEAAKKRNLQELRDNINILQANLVSIKSQLKTQQEMAAKLERNNQKVSAEMLKNIDTLSAEQVSIGEHIVQREKEYQTVSDRFDQDKKRFLEMAKPTNQ